MRLTFRAALRATAVSLAAITPFVIVGATQADARDRYDDFHSQLAQYGDWVYSDRWGEVWLPSDVPDDFRPYSNAGRWVNTDDYGWTWQSDYAWGDIAFHYGRWVNDPYDGWLWVPGSVWSPGWVVWRSNDRMIGWMPMPPDEQFLRGDDTSIGLSGGGFSVRFGEDNSYYGYSRWYGRDYDEKRFASNWTFVGTAHFADRDYRPNIENQANVLNIIHSTRNVTNYTVENNYVVNRSVDVHRVELASGHPVRPMKATEVLRNPSLVTRADVGHDTQSQAPHAIERGTGLPNSAPKPTASVVATLSTRPVERHGRPPAHLYTQTTIATAPLALAHAPAAIVVPAVQTSPATAHGAVPTPATNLSTTGTTTTPSSPPVKVNGQHRDTHRGHDDQSGTTTATPTPSTGTALTPPPDGNASTAPNGKHHDSHRGDQKDVTPAKPESPSLVQHPADSPSAKDAGPSGHNDRSGPAPKDSPPSKASGVHNRPPGDGSDAPQNQKDKDKKDKDKKDKDKKDKDNKENPDGSPATPN